MKSYIKKAVKKAIKNAKYFDDMFSVLDALNEFGNKACHDHVGKEKFFKGLQEMRYALLNEYAYTMHNAFIFTHCSNELQEYSKEKFKEYFSEEHRYNIMKFLEDFNSVPFSWSVLDEKEFRAQAKELIKEED